MAKANMATNENDSVLICGAGPTGLSTALGLARASVNVTVIDAEPAMNRTVCTSAISLSISQGIYFARKRVLSS